MLHLTTMTKHEMPAKAERQQGDNRPQPVHGLRDWLDHLSARNRLAVIKPNADLKFEIAAYAKRLDGQRATFFPRPGGHAVPVVSGIVSDRAWIAEAMGVEPDEMLTRFQEAALNPVPWIEPDRRPRRRSCIATSILPDCCRCRPTTSTTAGPISRPAS